MAGSSVGAVTRIAIAGASGRMGRMLIDAALADPQVALTALLDRADSPALGTVPTGTTIAITADVPAALAESDVLIDFTRPEGTLAHLAACVAAGKAIVIGTTGFDAAGKAAIAQAAQTIPVVFAPNMSVGVNVVFKLLELATQALGDQYDVEIFEAHHGKKVDAPSGTALGMGEAVARARGVKLDEVADWARHGHTGERKAGQIGFSVVRGGDVIGDHTAFFLGTGERVEISHRSSSRNGYAQGSVRAAKWLGGKSAGLFDMQDVLGLKH